MNIILKDFNNQSKSFLKEYLEGLDSFEKIDSERHIISKILSLNKEDLEEFIVNELDGFLPYQHEKSGKFNYAQIGGFWGGLSVSLILNITNRKSYFVFNYNLNEKYEVELNELHNFLKNKKKV
jgi:hypothetical protein